MAQRPMQNSECFEEIHNFLNVMQFIIDHKYVCASIRASYC